MSDSLDYKELVERSQHGDDESLNRLSEAAREQLYSYVFRLTMREELTQDVVQESMLEMFRFLDKLENADRFWPWLRRIALNKVRHHYTREKKRRMVSISDANAEPVAEDSAEGFSNLVTQELREIVSSTMSQLRTRYREVLVMRCYEQMEYSEIAEEMDCSEFSARVLFYRAKKSLAQQLSRRGLGKGALLTALVVFGKITAPSEAAASTLTVTAAATKVGTAAALAGMAGSKAVIVTLAAASVVTVGSIVVGPDKGNTGAPAGGGATATSAIGSAVGAMGNVRQGWYFLPNGPAGPVMVRQMMPGPGKQPYCSLIQNAEGNFRYDYSRNTVYQENFRAWAKDLSVMRLPTDDRVMTEFLDKVEGRSSSGNRVDPMGPGHLVITGQGRESMSLLHPSALDEEYFRYAWPGDTRVRDNRDEMHMRGWTCFEISGEIAGEKVSGIGRIPFVSNSFMQGDGAWFMLNLADRYTVFEGRDGSYEHDSMKLVWRRYPDGSFFAGFGRPWMGLHTIDTVRRDAARKRLPFATEEIDGGKKARVTVFSSKGELVYTIDLYRDLVDRIELTFKDGATERTGVLDFSYDVEIDRGGDSVLRPGPSRPVKGDSGRGIEWLFDFAGNSVLR